MRTAVPVKGMIDAKYLRVLRELCRRLSDGRVNWALTGSFNLALQGVPVEIHDIDVQTDKVGASEIENRFSEFVTRKVAVSSAERIRSYFGALMIDGVKVEIRGDVQKWFENGDWEPPVNLKCCTETVTVGKMQVPVLSLGYECQAYLKLGRTEKAEILKKFLSSRQATVPDLEFYPLTSERWTDLEKLFGERGACEGCWCMWWRMSRSEFERQKGEGNKKALKKLVDSGKVPGILAYANGQPIGWCSVFPREAFPALERSRTMRRVDDESVWSIVCFFIAKQFRRKGVTGKLLKAVVKHVRDQGGKIVEGYPVDPKSPRTPIVFAYTGLASTFSKVGFVEVMRRSETRPIMRYVIGKNE